MIEIPMNEMILLEIYSLIKRNVKKYSIFSYSVREIKITTEWKKASLHIIVLITNFKFL